MAVDIKDVEHLAGLARIAVSDDEKKILQHDLEGILTLVSKIKDATADDSAESRRAVSVEARLTLRNVMRADGEPHESGIFTDELLAQAPARDGNRVLVKKIL